MNSKLIILISILVYVNCDVKNCIFKGKCDDNNKFCIEEFDPIELKDDDFKSFAKLCPYLLNEEGPTTCCDSQDLKRIIKFTYENNRLNLNPCLKALNQFKCHLYCNQNQRKYIRILDKSESKQGKYQAEIISVTVNIEDINKLYGICSNAFTPTNKEEESFYYFMKNITDSIEFAKILGESFSTRVFFNINDNGNLTRLEFDSRIKVIGSVQQPLKFEFDTN